MGRGSRGGVKCCPRETSSSSSSKSSETSLSSSSQELGNQCDNCLDEVPRKWLALIQNVTNGTCGTCPLWNDLWILNQQNSCTWGASKSVPNTNGCGTSILMSLIITQDAGNTVFTVRGVYGPLIIFEGLWRKTYSGLVDCLTITEEDIPPVAGSNCQKPAGSCTLTAV